MGLAVDTIGLYYANPGAAGHAPNVNAGDSLTIRAFTPSSYAGIEHIFFQGATEGFVQITSPRLHDNVRGLRFEAAETPSRMLLPHQVVQPVFPQDTLAALLGGGTAETDAFAIQVGYDDLPGASARLHSWGDISGNIQDLKWLTVANTPGTAGVWSDVVVTTTEDLLIANRDYAVLGGLVDVASCAFGIKGSETANLRVCIPGALDTLDTSDWFIRQSQLSGKPRIPVFNAANRFALYASLLQTGTTATNVQFLLALLTNNLPS